MGIVGKRQSDDRKGECERKREREKALVEVWQQTGRLMEIRLSERQSVSVASHTPRCFLTDTRLFLWAAITEHCHFPLLSLFLRAIRHWGFPFKLGFLVLALCVCSQTIFFHTGLLWWHEHWVCKWNNYLSGKLFLWWQTNFHLFAVMWDGCFSIWLMPYRIVAL